MQTVNLMKPTSTVEPPQTNRSNCGALLLAAGFSRRYGSVKLDARLSCGRTLFEQSFANIKQVTDEIIVVGREELLIGGTYDCLQTNPARLILCPDAEHGMGHSLAAGIRAIPDHWEACLICLADMPSLSSQTLHQIIAASAAERIVVPIYQGTKGHPVSFGRNFYHLLEHSKGDLGARQLINQFSDSVVTLNLQDKGILIDVDRPQELP
jgi:molybdenum cofactor cytidylyltransferase